jgi:glycosyltransferase involved in cell wall biosynthesis
MEHGLLQGKAQVPLTPSRISVAIPLHDEEVVFPELLGRVGAVLDSLPGGPHEIVFVDDGSVDRTFELMSEAAAGDPRVVGVRLSRNFGHQAALTAALETATGDVVVVMDGDLQDRPEEIPRLLAEYERGYDVVYAQRVERKEAPALRASYFVFYRLMNRLSEIKVPVDSGDFALLSRRVVDQINLLPERHRYLRGLRTWVGFRQIGIPVERDVRAGGEPSYTMGKLFRLAFDGVFAFSVTPLRVAWLLGACATAAASLYATYVVFERLFLGESPKGFTALIVAITFFSGVQLLSLGLIGEYLGRVYDEAKARPHFVVTEVVRGDRAGPASPPAAPDSPSAADVAVRA